MRTIWIGLAMVGLGLGQERPGGFRGDFLRQLEDVEKKIVGLAQAMPQEKYGWRPGEGVRSNSEVYVHIAGANFGLPNFVGVKPPAGLSRDMEKTVTEKAKVIETLKESFEHIRKACMSVPDSDLDKEIKMFGRPSTVRGAFFLMANHMHEHLGQAIAYARTNGVTPPWSEK
ncbi:MAG: DinB family protein [Acidobacteria bacterium]|nr:DinB family protein [Acidobacteriota bacterium]